MKYIKTKEYGICKIINEDKHALSYENSDVIGCLWKDSYKDKIQYADTIEELCDQFVLLDHKKDFLLANNNFPVIKEIWENNRNTEIYIYGAVFTDKGLIYVAKMNDKGELVLL